MNNKHNNLEEKVYEDPYATFRKCVWSVIITLSIVLIISILTPSPNEKLFNRCIHNEDICKIIDEYHAYCEDNFSPPIEEKFKELDNASRYAFKRYMKGEISSVQRDNICKVIYNEKYQLEKTHKTTTGKVLLDTAVFIGVDPNTWLKQDIKNRYNLVISKIYYVGASEVYYSIKIPDSDIEYAYNRILKHMYKTYEKYKSKANY